MKTKLFLFLTGSILILQSCATSPTMTISAVATMDQKVGYGNTIVSQKRHFVAFTPYTQLESAISNISMGKDKAKFMLTVENGGNDPIEFGYKNISVIFVPKANDVASRPITVQAWREFMEELDKEYEKNERKYIYNILNGLYAVTLFGSTDSMEGLDVKERLKNLVFDIESMRDQKDVLEEMLPGIIIKQGRILPGKSHNGLLICDTSDLDIAMEGDFRISLAIDGEEHRFIFKRGISR